jgi:hypothetical protein
MKDKDWTLERIGRGQAVAVMDLGGYGTLRLTFTGERHVYVWTDARKGDQFNYHGETWEVGLHLWEDRGWSNHQPLGAVSPGQVEPLRSYSREKGRAMPPSWERQTTEILMSAVIPWISERPGLLLEVDKLGAEIRLDSERSQIREWEEKIENAKAGCLQLETDIADLEQQIVCAEVRKSAAEAAQVIVRLARESGDDPIAWVTGSQYMPPIRSIAAAEEWYQKDQEGTPYEGMFGYFCEEVEQVLETENVLMASPDTDNALYAVDMQRWQHAGNDDAETLQGEWKPV